MKTKNEKENNKELIKNKNFFNKFFNMLKKKWLLKGTTTALLILIIICAFISINIVMEKINLTPLDFTEEKLHTLTNESKDKVKNINKEVNIYFVGYSESDAVFDLAKQYNKLNEKINVEIINSQNRPDLVQKYGIESDRSGIIIESGEKNKVLSTYDLSTYDQTSNSTVSIAEEKLTSTILAISADEIPKVYFLGGYSDYTLDNNMNSLYAFFENEVIDIEDLNILTVGKVPDDCSTLVITTPSKDFDDIATNAIINYINSGGNILWFNGAITTTEKENMSNVKKILDIYGVKQFEVGTIFETSSSNIVSKMPNVIIPELGYSKITNDLYSAGGVILVGATKINIDEEKLEELNVTKTDLLTTSENAFFRTNFENKTITPQEDEEKGSFIVGAELDKTIKTDEENNEKIESKLIIYGENYFVSDYPLGNEGYPTILYGANRNIAQNSIAYLVERKEDITARKGTGTVGYTATEKQDIIIRIIIFTIPIFIIMFGIILWNIRRKK